MGNVAEAGSKKENHVSASLRRSKSELATPGGIHGHLKNSGHRHVSALISPTSLISSSSVLKAGFKSASHTINIWGKDKLLKINRRIFQGKRIFYLSGHGHTFCSESQLKLWAGSQRRSSLHFPSRDASESSPGGCPYYRAWHPPSMVQVYSAEHFQGVWRGVTNHSVESAGERPSPGQRHALSGMFWNMLGPCTPTALPPLTDPTDSWLLPSVGAHVRGEDTPSPWNPTWASWLVSECRQLRTLSWMGFPDHLSGAGLGSRRLVFWAPGRAWGGGGEGALLAPCSLCSGHTALSACHPSSEASNSHLVRRDFAFEFSAFHT